MKDASKWNTSVIYQLLFWNAVMFINTTYRKGLRRNVRCKAPGGGMKEKTSALREIGQMRTGE
jgi:hypothetical protein